MLRVERSGSKVRTKRSGLVGQESAASGRVGPAREPQALTAGVRRRHVSQFQCCHLRVPHARPRPSASDCSLVGQTPIRRFPSSRHYLKTRRLTNRRGSTAGLKRSTAGTCRCTPPHRIGAEYGPEEGGAPSSVSVRHGLFVSILAKGAPGKARSSKAFGFGNRLAVCDRLMQRPGCLGGDGGQAPGRFLRENRQ